MYSLLWERPGPQTEDEWLAEQLAESAEYRRIRDEHESEQDRRTIQSLVRACVVMGMRPSQNRILAMMKACAARGMRRDTLRRLIADAIAVETEIHDA